MSKQAAFFDKVKMSARDYLGLYEEPASEVADVLCELTAQKGMGILLDPQALPEAMRANGAQEGDIFRVCVMTQVTGYREIMNNDSRTEQLDLDRYIQNAVAESGLTREMVLRLTGALAKAAGIGMSYTGEKAVVSDAGYVMRQLAEGRYQKDLDEFGQVFERVRKNKKSKEELDFTMVEALANAGIPRAGYYMGYCLLHGLQLPMDEAQGLLFLQLAANNGDSKASAELGDYHYEKRSSTDWTEAYRYYTGYGAPAMNGDRKGRLRNIFNQKIFNKSTLVLSGILFLLTLVTVILAPGAAVYGAAPFWGVVALLLELASMALHVLWFRNKPYDDYYSLPVSLMVIWSAYMAIMLLF